MADFGLSRMHPNLTKFTQGHKMTEYMSTRWYRAPEILATKGDYTEKSKRPSCYLRAYVVDSWGIGCVMMELIFKESLFNGKTTLECLE